MNTDQNLPYLEVIRSIFLDHFQLSMLWQVIDRIYHFHVQNIHSFELTEPEIDDDLAPTLFQPGP